MPDNADILRAAALLIEEYGEMAPMGAVIRADHLSARGNAAGQAAWLEIARIAEDMLAGEKPETAPLH